MKNNKNTPNNQNMMQKTIIETNRIFFSLSGQKFKFSISFTSFTKSLVIGTLALLSIFNGKDNKMVF